MRTIADILNDLANTSSRNEKLAILRGNVDNDLLKQVLVYALDPFKNFYIRKIPTYNREASRPSYALQQALADLDVLSSRDQTGNAAITYLADLLGCLEDSDAQVIERVIQKDLRCGVSDATVNKVWPNLIPVYSVMLASGYDEKLVSQIQFPAMAQLKMDGMRFNAIVKDGAVEFRSRNGKLLDLKGKLDSDFISMSNGANVVFDGELTVRKDGRLLPRQEGNGILSKAQKGTISDSEADMVCATVWDMYDYESAVRGFDNAQYYKRFNRLLSIVLPEKVDFVESFLVENIEQAQALFEAYLAAGQEGIILKDINAPWENKRVRHMIKFKGEFECDLRIVGWEEGTGKNVGRLGALVLESEDGILKVNVGTGFTDEHRDTITPDVVGKVVAIKYNGKIRDQKTGIDSLFLPVFVEIRDDKDTADNFEDIK